MHIKKQKVIVITGANGNVGSYFAKQYLMSGEYLILMSHKNQNRIEKLQQDYPEQIQIIKSDLRDLETMQNELSKIVNSNKCKLTRLIHTATIHSYDFQPLANTDPHLWKEIIEINLFGTFNILKATLPYFRQNKYGKIVMFGSNVSRIGLPNGSAYSASKAGIANIGRTVAVEEAENDIIINTVSPGPIKIDNSQFSESYRTFREEYYKEKLEQIPLRRHASFEDIFGLCKFLPSKENSYITGEEFFVTGGKL